MGHRSTCKYRRINPLENNMAEKTTDFTYGDDFLSTTPKV